MLLMLSLQNTIRFNLGPLKTVRERGFVVMKDTKTDLLKKNEKYIWHSMKPYNPENTMIAEESNGAWVTDIDGARYFDAMAGLWCVNAGYGREELAEAAHEQLKKMAYFPLVHSHEPAIQLAEELNGWLGGDYVIFFSNSGSEANEAAFKMARQYHSQKGDHNRYKIISRYRGYHGNSMGALAATGQAQRKFKYEPLTPGFLHVAPPDNYRDDDPMKRAEEIDQIITWEMKETVAAVIIEPIITGGGVIMPPDDYMAKVQEICDKHGVLLISDEVICGFGRTGKPFGFQQYGVQPDIVTMAKGITSGYLPLSATAVKKEIYDQFKDQGEYDYFRHVNTFGGNPAACKLALKNLEIMKEEKLVEQSAHLGEKMLHQLKELENHPNVGNVRGKGLLIGIELVEDKQTKSPISNEKIGKVIGACKEKQLLIGKNGATVAGFNNVLTLSPPLNITENDVDFIVETLTSTIYGLCE